VINDQRLSPAYSLSIFRGPLCEMRQVIHGPNHFKIRNNRISNAPVRLAAEESRCPASTVLELSFD